MRDEMNQEAESALVASLWSWIEDHLARKRQRIYDEIKDYPRPIPACDLQFNHLLEDRAGILEEMARMHQACNESLGGRASLAALRDYVRACNYLDQEARKWINSALEGANCAGIQASN
jgi:hypothetical protein